MFVKELHIVNFKNIAEATFTFCPRFNCMVGNNGVGKTNVLDALYLLSMCKSYFGLPDSQNIRHHEPFFVLQGKYERQGEDVDVYCGVKRGQKKVFKKKLFISAPIHHHLEAKGWNEAKIVMRFWVIAGVFAIIGVFLAAQGIDDIGVFSPGAASGTQASVTVTQLEDTDAQTQE